jgi:hypothetical protein
MSRKLSGILVAMLCLVLMPLTAGQVKLTGDINGLVVDANGESLPGVSITLTGAKLFQSSQVVVSNEKGAFRFLSLNPGEYTLECRLPGFDVLIVTATVSVGTSTTVRARMIATIPNQEVVVKAQAPLIETRSVQTSINYSEILVKKVPTTRNVQDLMDAAPAINDNGAYGAGARVRDDYYKGSGANAYLLNGVDISDAATGATWVNPNYDSIEEIQVIGIGASAEYGNYSGAVLNVVTKTGGNRVHGGLSSYFMNKSFYGDNSGGIEDLKPQIVKINSESSAHMGGPLIKEKLFFFLAGGYTAIQTRREFEPAYGSLKQPRFQANFSWLPSPKHAVSLMANFDPLNHDNLGLQVGSGPEIGYSRRFRSAVWNAGWRYIASANTIFEFKYAGFKGSDLTDPVSPDTSQVLDYSTYRFYGSSGTIETYDRIRHNGSASLTQYLDDFLGVSHEVKLGFEYEDSETKNDARLTGPGATQYYVIPIPSFGLYEYFAMSNYIINTVADVRRVGGYLQDNIQIGRRANLNLGVRLDVPQLSSPGRSGRIARLTNIAPRLGFSYDITGDAKNVVHIGYGRYYDKMVTDPFSSAMPGMSAIELYDMYTTTPFEATQEFIDGLPDMVLRAENLFYVMPAPESIGVDSKLKGPHTDVLNLKYERQLFGFLALSLEYVHKRDRGFIGMATSTPHTYAEVQWTDPFLGNTVPVWGQTDFAPDSWSYANSTWAKRRHNFFVASLRTRTTEKWALQASFVYQDSQGNIDNESHSIGAAAMGMDTDPNFTDNPLIWGKLRYDRTYQAKILGTYSLPWGINLAADVHVLSGVAWNPKISASLTELNFPNGGTVFLEKRGSRRTPMTWFLNVRTAKQFRIGDSLMLELMADVFNVFNRANTAYVAYEPFFVYPLSGEPGFGKPFALADPIHLRLGFRLLF